MTTTAAVLFVIIFMELIVQGVYLVVTDNKIEKLKNRLDKLEAKAILKPKQTKQEN